MASCWSAFLLFGASLLRRRLCCGRDLVELHRDTLCRNQERRAARAASATSPLSGPRSTDEESGVLLSGATRSADCPV